MNKMFRLPAISETAAGSPVELEDPVGVGHGGAVQRKGLGSGGRGSEVDEAVSSIAPTTHIRNNSLKFKSQLWCLTQRTCHGSS